MKKNFKDETLRFIESKGYRSSDIIEYSIILNLHPSKESAVCYKGTNSSFHSIIDLLNIEYFDTDRYEGLIFKGWITFIDHSFIKRIYNYPTYYSQGTEEWEYIKFPKLSDEQY